jgi:hypothetical protein
MKKLPRSIEIITWDDAHSIDAWTDVSEIVSTKLSPIVTVGFVLAETKDGLYVAGSLDLSAEKVDPVFAACGTMTIPKKLIKSRKRVAFHP